MNQDALMLLVLAAVGVAMLWTLLVFTRWLHAFRIVSRRLVCPLHGTTATVDFLVDAQGPEVYRDVVGCSLLTPGETVRCGKTCRSTSVAPFGEPVGDVSKPG